MFSFKIYDVIIKCLSRKSNVDQLIKYILADNKVIPAKEPARIPQYISGIKLTDNDRKHLESERIDAKLMAELKAFKGDLKEYVKQFVSQTRKPEIEERKLLLIKENVRSKDTKGYIKEFEENEKMRLHIRKDSVKAFHTIISFSALDSKYLDQGALAKIADKFISLRGKNSLHLGAVHYDRENTIHMHLITSGTAYCTGKSNRMSKQEFQELKKSMTEFQLKEFPKMVHSLPEHGKSKNLGRGEKNVKIHERTDKVALTRLLETTYSQSQSTEHFLGQIEAQGHEIYYRNGRLQGIKYNGSRKFRLANLGYDKDKLEALDLKKAKGQTTLEELQTLRANSQTHKMLEQSYSKLNTVIDTESSPVGDEKQRQKQQEILDQNRAFEEKYSPSISNTDVDKSIQIDAQLDELRSLRNRTNERSLNETKDYDTPSRVIDDDIVEMKNDTSEEEDSRELKEKEDDLDDDNTRGNDSEGGE